MLEQAVLKYSKLGFKQPRTSDVPGSTPFVTGDINVDNFLNHMLVDHGIRVTVGKGMLINRVIKYVEIIDQDKASWFLLKWAQE